MGKRVYIRDWKKKADDPGQWPERKKMEVLMAYLASGNMVTVASVTGVPYTTIKFWKNQPWWKERTDAFYEEDKVELDAKYQKIIRKCLEVTEDRLENGNFLFDQKTGRVTRVPVALRDSHVVMKDMVAQQQILRKDPIQTEIAKDSINDRLVKLAEQFALMAMGKVEKTIEPSGGVFEGEVIPEPIQAQENGSEAV